MVALSANDISLVVLINLWRGIRAKVSFNATKEMNDVERCLAMLSLYEDRFEMAGRLRRVTLKYSDLGIPL